MTIHKEGYATIAITVLALAGLHIFGDQFLSSYPAVRFTIFILSLLILLIILQFFRHPNRKIIRNDKHVIAPADGKVVVIEETEEDEFLKDKRIQVSIFMSPLNVHVNRYPVSGKVLYSRYHPGLYLVAWHPKSSVENERTSVVIETGTHIPVLVRQIAGALARRIVCYPREGWMVKQGEEMGFIKFGSRVDLFLPPGTKIHVSLNQKVRGGETVLAEFS
ncbi:MAG: phosphatidylserine decarboxylase family protein [Bacteroidia bacterium]|nr:phosphatidylserine decarboxylase family protein [Bacteroidia bacterium]